MSQGAKDGDATSMDGLADVCSCIIGTSAFHGGRMSQGAKDGDATQRTMAEWQSGYAAACKAVDSGSIPLSASNI